MTSIKSQIQLVYGCILQFSKEGVNISFLDILGVYVVDLLNSEVSDLHHFSSYKLLLADRKGQRLAG